MTTQAMALALLGLCFNEVVKGKEDIEAFIDKLRTRRGFREKTRDRIELNLASQRWLKKMPTKWNEDVERTLLA